jgi:undecaprenyl-diphosphatase
MKRIISGIKSNRFDSIIFVAILILFLAALLSYFFIDKLICRGISSISTDIDDFTGSGLLKSLGKVYVPLWLLLIWGYAKNNSKLVLAAVMSLLMALLITNPLKFVTRRERPREVFTKAPVTLEWQEDRSKSHDKSFPSSDTAMVFAHAVVVTPLLSAMSLPVIYILAAAVGILRILGMAHYPSDVLTGTAIGILCGWLAIKVSGIWISENKFRIKEWWRKVVPIAIIVIPVVTFLAGDRDNLIIFFVTSIVLAGLIYLLNKIPAFLSKFSNSQAVEKT